MMERTGMDPLVSVRNLRVSFRLDRDHTFEAVKGISFDIPKNTHGRAGRRVRQRQVGDGAGDPRPAAARELDHRRRRAAILFGGRNVVDLSPATCARCAAPRSR